MQRRKFDPVGAPMEPRQPLVDEDGKPYPPTHHKHAWYKLVQAMVGYQDMDSFTARIENEVQDFPREALPATLLLFEVKSPSPPPLAHALAQVLCWEARRANDRVTALEGSRFALLLPSTDEVGAMSVGQRIVKAFRFRAQAMGFTADGSIAVGVATTVDNLPGKGIQVVSRAESNLHQAAASEEDCLLGSDGPVWVEANSAA